jgi:mono/diheme cytochrome c family protein
MKRLPTLLGIVVVISFALGLEADPQSDVKEVPITWKQVALGDGEDLYIELCAVCHGVDATGKGPAASALSSKVPDLTRLAQRNNGDFPTAEVRKAITGESEIPAHGTSEMPMWGKVLQDVRPDVKPTHREGFAQLRIYNLTSYLETVQID